MNIVFFCEEYPPKPHGGIGTFVQTLATALVNAGHGVSVLEFGPRAGERIQDGVKIVSLVQSRIPKINWLVNRFRLWRWLNSEISSNRVDIFEMPEYQGWLPFPLRSKNKAKVVIRLHLSSTAIRKFAGDRFCCRDFLCEFLTLYFHRNWLGVSQYIIDLTSSIFRINPRYYDVVYNPITIKQKELISLPEIRPKSDPYVLFVGSMTERKGVLSIARAARIVNEAGSKIQFVFIGPDTVYKGRPISEEILRIAGGGDERITFLGRRGHAEVLHWMKFALTVALPSRLEAFGLVPVEAMALGVPAIYTTLPPGPEIIRHGEDGILVRPDDHDGLASEIMKLAADGYHATRLGNAGMIKAKSIFSINSCVRHSIECYFHLNSR